MTTFFGRLLLSRLGPGFATNSNAARPVALRSKKQKSLKPLSQAFVDIRHIRLNAGRGGDGCISFLQLWANENAGPDGGDGGNGGHVVFQSSSNVSDLKAIPPEARAEHGERGFNKDCCGRNAKHTFLQVPVGTVVRDSQGNIVADLSKDGMMMVAARGGAGGRGNHYFANDVLQSPHIAEYGAEGEQKKYILEVKTMAHIGLLGMPNAGKSTLLRSISRARPKVASYPFTTLKPHLGVVKYNDYVQVTVADLPGLIEGSHRNRGLGIQFLQHAERCGGLLYVVDLAMEEPWQQINVLRAELAAFNQELVGKLFAVVANKIDLPEAKANLEAFTQSVDLPVIPVSAKMGTNISLLLDEVRKMYDDSNEDVDS